MSCTSQSAFQRQLFIKMFSGTFNQENVTTDVQSVRDEGIILQCTSFTSCDLFLTSVFNPVLDPIVCNEDSFKVFMTF